MCRNEKLKRQNEKRRRGLGESSVRSDMFRICRS